MRIPRPERGVPRFEVWAYEAEQFRFKAGYSRMTKARNLLRVLTERRVLAYIYDRRCHRDVVYNAREIRINKRK